MDEMGRKVTSDPDRFNSAQAVDRDYLAKKNGEELAKHLVNSGMLGACERRASVPELLFRFAEDKRRSLSCQAIEAADLEKLSNYFAYSSPPPKDIEEILHRIFCRAFRD